VYVTSDRSTNVLTFILVLILDPILVLILDPTRHR
jgi:hypothetical protein